MAKNFFVTAKFVVTFGWGRYSVKYQCEVIVNRPRDEVVAKFDSRENLNKWQPTLKNAEPISGDQGKPGATMRLVYGGRGRDMSMIETIDSNHLPDSFSATYVARGVVNPCINTFTDLGDGSTKWAMNTEFRLSGLMAVMSLFMRRAFPRQTQSMMDNFKIWVEST